MLRVENKVLLWSLLTGGKVPHRVDNGKPSSSSSGNVAESESQCQHYLPWWRWQYTIMAIFAFPDLTTWLQIPNPSPLPPEHRDYRWASPQLHCERRIQTMTSQTLVYPRIFRFLKTSRLWLMTCGLVSERFYWRHSQKTSLLLIQNHLFRTLSLPAAGIIHVYHHN